MSRKVEPLQPKPHVANCVGFECPERDSCLRYLRPAWRAGKDKDGKLIVQTWASYDIERKRFKTCEAKIVLHGAVNTAMGRAFVRATA
jgi:hypothetical protein